MADLKADLKTDLKIKKTKELFLVLTLMLTIIIDIMGLGLVFPTLPELFIGAHSALDSQTSSIHWQEFYYGLAMAVWPLGLFFGAPAFGHLSDMIGRRKVLLSCLLMTGATYAVCALAIDLRSMWLFILGRLISGFFAGSFEIAQAVIADISPQEKKARNMGWITLAASLGFTVGPLISGLTMGAHWVSWFNLSTPFWIAMILSLLNMLSLFCLLKESYRHVGEFKVDWLACFESVSFIFSDKRVRYLGLVFLLLQFSWAMYFGPMTAIMQIQFGSTGLLLGLFFAVLGLGFGVGTIVIQPVIQKFFSLKWMVCIGLLGTAILLGISAISPSAMVQWGVVFFSSMIEVLAYTGSVALFSNSVSDTEQGTVLGGVGSLASVSWCLSGLLTGPALSVSWHVPLSVSAVFMLLAALMMLGFRKALIAKQ